MKRLLQTDIKICFGNYQIFLNLCNELRLTYHGLLSVTQAVQ